MSEKLNLKESEVKRETLLVLGLDKNQTRNHLQLQLSVLYSLLFYKKAALPLVFFFRNFEKQLVFRSPLDGSSWIAASLLERVSESMTQILHRLFFIMG